ncbi:YxeA family protein [Latilactobacillus sakei]|nr:YxeA family protein [Latilactobacillus sakei]MDR7924002.1 YxeA family protein [Latilactobacillus sakei subsp. sakei]QMU87114.1 YxeA family protein [Latilactobacillus sakei]
MFKRKGWLLLIIIVIFFIGGSWGIKEYYYGGETYYTQITTDGTKQVDKDTEGKSYVSYQYDLPAYDQAGHQKKVSFNSAKSSRLQKQAYLELKVNDRKGVMSWQKVDKADLPKAAKKALAKQSNR